jgi:site-specific DNA-methyltransferase (adenine-specific)
MSWRMHHGDCREVMASMDADSVDAIVSDPPYGLAFMGKGWDHAVPGVEFWAEALRVAKPGAHLVAFGGTRTFHRLACAIEDAGWEVRDTLSWLYGSGFPKSHDVSKAMDKAAGAEREVVSEWRTGRSGTLGGKAAFGGISGEDVRTITAPATNLARQWSGWGTALKPAWEPIILARKPLAGTVAANVALHGTGALNVDGCRVEYASDGDKAAALAGDAFKRKDTSDAGWSRPWMNDQEKVAAVNARAKERAQSGRWPANVVLDEDAAAQVGEPSRFFFVAKASRREREAGLEGVPERVSGGMSGTADGTLLTGSGNVRNNRAANHHPTVKPIALMRWLCRLVTPPGGVVLDPFTGSGTTGCAAVLEGFGFVGIEQDAEYVAIAEARIAHWEYVTPIGLAL